MKKTSLMRKLYSSKIFWMIISLLIAAALWSYIASLNTDEFNRTFRGVRVELVGEDILRDSRNMVVTDLDTNSVTVEIVGPRRVVGMLSEADLVAQVDVSKLTQAAYTSQTYTIKYPDGTETSALQVNSKTPEVVNFTVSSLTNKTIEVRGSFEGSLAEGYTAEAPVFEPSTITVSGPEVYLKNVSYAWVTFGQDDTSQTYSVETGFTLMDKSGEECSTTGLSFSTDKITATLPILEVKEIPLSVDILEGSGANSSNIMVDIEPKSITLAGDSAILAGKNKITLATIDVTDFAVSFTDTYMIPLDDNIRNLSGVTEAKVTVTIVGLETRRFTVRNLNCINVTDGYEADIISENIVVTLRGTEEQLSNIKDENLRAVADLEDYKNSTGLFMPEVKIYIDGFSEVGAVGAYTMSIEIRRSQS